MVLELNRDPQIWVDDELELRLLRDEDAERLFDLTQANRAHLREWLPWVDSTRTVEDTRRFIRTTQRQQLSHNGFHMGIWCQHELAGVIGYNYIHPRRQMTELGYWLGQRWQGQGVMTRCCGALLDHAFGPLGLERVEIRCSVTNVKSRAIPERLGFNQDGTVVQFEWTRDCYIQVAVYGMTRSRWQQPG